MDSNDRIEVFPVFQGAFLKAQWAAQNIDNLYSAILSYENTGIRYFVDQTDENQSVMYAFADPLNIPVAEITGDIIRNLRGSLDYAVSAIYRAHGLRDDTFEVRWHTGKNVESVKSAVEGTLKKRGLGDLSDFFIGADHTETSNSPIFYLNQIDRANKHRSLNIVVAFALTPVPDFTAGEIIFRNNGLLVTPGHMAKETLPVPVADLNLHYDVKSALHVTFGPSEAFPNRQVIPTLRDLYQLVLECLSQFQETCRNVFPEKF